jgi:hypothetical protein
MKSYSTIALAALLSAMLVAIDHFLGRRVLWLTGGFSTIWSLIAFVLLSRPPGIPEFVTEKPGSDEQHVIRREIVLRLSLKERLSLSLSVACGSCLLLWLTLGLLAR